jgi:hypothetical protein
LPDADETLFVSGFLIRKQRWSHKLSDYYYFKPIELRAKNEKAYFKVVKPELYILYGDY